MTEPMHATHATHATTNRDLELELEVGESGSRRSVLLEDEAIRFAADLLRIDTTNTGDSATSAGERVAAEFVSAILREVGYSPVMLAPPGHEHRTSVVVRYCSPAPVRPPLLVHGHLDVVPANPQEWSVPPFSGLVRDGYLWGRGAVDMKGMVGMMLALARHLQRESVAVERDIVFAFFADEEAGGTYGAGWLVDTHPELFDGVTEAIGEAGGFSVHLKPGVRAYLVQSAEKGKRWVKLTATGRPGHASMLHENNPVATLGAALGRLGKHQFPVTPTTTVTSLIEGLNEIVDEDLSYQDTAAILDHLTSMRSIIGATFRDTAAPTVVHAGYKSNVIPSSATAEVDCRILPGRSAAFTHEFAEVIGPDVTATWHEQNPVETSFDGHLVDMMTAAIHQEDPGSHVLPYMMSGATDAKRLQRIGIRCFGFTPLQLPEDLVFPALFHGIDERVPLDALRFGVRVLDRLVRSA